MESFVVSDQYDGDKKEFEAIEPGKHKAICYKIVDGGTAEEGGLHPGIKHKIYVYWELPDERTTDDKPKSIFKSYNLVFGEKSAIAEDFGEWRGKSFTDAERKTGIDILQFLGKGCMLRTGKTNTGNDKVERVLEFENAFDKDGELRKLPTHNELEFFNLKAYCKEFSGESDAESKEMCDKFELLPRFLQYRIGGCDEIGKDQVDPCLEVQNAMKKGSGKGGEAVVTEPAPEPKSPESGTMPPQKIADDFEDDIPF